MSFFDTSIKSRLDHCLELNNWVLNSYLARASSTSATVE